MASLLEYVGNVHIFLGPYRGNPIALYLSRNGDRCEIAPKVYPWNQVVGEGDTPNRAAADFESKWKVGGLSPEMYTGPSWEGGIKPERPAPPKPPPAPKPAALPTQPVADAKPPVPAATVEPKPGADSTVESTPAPAAPEAGAAATQPAADPTVAPTPSESGTANGDKG